MLQMNTISEEVPQQQMYYHGGAGGAAQAPGGAGLAPYGPGWQDDGSPSYIHRMGLPTHGMVHSQGGGPESEPYHGSHVQLPYINLAGIPYQMTEQPNLMENRGRDDGWYDDGQG